MKDQIKRTQEGLKELRYYLVSYLVGERTYLHSNQNLVIYISGKPYIAKDLLSKCLLGDPNVLGNLVVTPNGIESQDASQIRLTELSREKFIAYRKMYVMSIRQQWRDQETKTTGHRARFGRVLEKIVQTSRQQQDNSDQSQQSL